MKWSYAARHGDPVGLAALDMLKSQGRSTLVVDDRTTLAPNTVALFGTDAKTRSRYLRLAKHRMEQEGIEVPKWAEKLPFVVAVNAKWAAKYPHGLAIALREMASAQAAWWPGMLSPEAPWNPQWLQSCHPNFPAWRKEAREAVKDLSTIERLTHRLEPIFSMRTQPPIKRLMITGCANFNKPHTDVVDALPAWKCEFVVEELRKIVDEAAVESASFVVPRGDLVCDALRDHYHPFMFMSLDEVSHHVGYRVGPSARILGEAHAHARTDAEVARAMDISGDMLEREIVQRLQSACTTPVRAITWSDYIGPYVERATAIAQRHIPVAEGIYEERVATRESYASLHKIDPARGLKRTVSNVIMYIAEAMYLKDHPEVAVVNCEYADTFWKRLENILECHVWGMDPAFIGMTAQNVRQPWGY